MKTKTNSGIASEEFRPAKDGEVIIAVLQRGWIVVGKYAQDGSTGTLTEAKVIRRWGTQHGLGELAIKGPLSDTILDPCPPVKFHIREAVFFMMVNPEVWRGK